MTHPLVVFRADASSQIGAGHVMRCAALALALREIGVEVHFICRTLAGDLRGWLRDHGYVVHELPAPKSRRAGAEAGLEHWECLRGNWRLDCEQTAGVIESIGRSPDWLAVDHYALDANWEGHFKAMGLNLLVIDDLADRAHVCDLLLDQTLGRLAVDYQSQVPGQCEHLLGPDYALLRPAFSGYRQEALERRRACHRPYRLLVALGGGDPTGLLPKVLQCLDRPGANYEMSVVAGPMYPDLQTLETLCNELAVACHLYPTVEDMGRLMVDADLVIGAAGSSAWERCCLGLPSVTLIVAENQKSVAAALADQGATLVAAQPAELPAMIDHLVGEEAYLDMSRKAAAVCDGLGARRAAMRLFPELSRLGEEVTLRAVEAVDSKILFEWQSQAATRKYARNSTPPSREEHEAWFAAKLADRQCYFFMIESAGDPAGTVRLDPAWGRQGEFEVSINVDPGRFQQGLGLCALNLLRRLLPDISIRAFVKPENRASLKLFSKAGYLQREDGFFYQTPPYETGNRHGSPRD